MRLLGLVWVWLRWFAGWLFGIYLFVLVKEMGFVVFVYRLPSSLDCGLCCGFNLVTVVGCVLLVVFWLLLVCLCVY